MKLEWESTEAKEDRQWNWHQWFAWYPVRIGPRDVRWLETVERSGGWRWGGIHMGNVWKWSYRLPAEPRP